MFQKQILYDSNDTAVYSIKAKIHDQSRFFTMLDCHVTTSLLSMNFIKGSLDRMASACKWRSCAASTEGVAVKGFWSCLTTTIDEDGGGEAVPGKACVVEGGGVTECEVECEVDSTGVRLVCIAGW
jgi:hypothetical protein